MSMLFRFSPVTYDNSTATDAVHAQALGRIAANGRSQSRYQGFTTGQSANTPAVDPVAPDNRPGSHSPVCQVVASYCYCEQKTA